MPMPREGTDSIAPRAPGAEKIPPAVVNNSHPTRLRAVLSASRRDVAASILACFLLVPRSIGSPFEDNQQSHNDA